MTNQIIKIKDYSPKTSEVYFFDNNVWMFLFCPLGNYEKDFRQRVYSRLFENLISLKIPIFINTLVLSEFCNAYLKLDFNLTNNNPDTAGMFKSFKKDFVGSEQYTKTVKEIKRNIENILKLTEKCSDEFTSINMTDVLSDFTKIGFNDSYYMTLSLKKKWIIVSDDSDFTRNIAPQKNLTILTA